MIVCALLLCMIVCLDEPIVADVDVDVRGSFVYVECMAVMKSESGTSLSLM